MLSGHTGQATYSHIFFIYSQGPRGFVEGSHAEQPLPVLSPGPFYVPPLPSIWALRNTVFRRDAEGRDSMDMETLIHTQVLRKWLNWSCTRARVGCTASCEFTLSLNVGTSVGLLPRLQGCDAQQSSLGTLRYRLGT